MPIYLSREGAKKLEDELKFLEEKERPRIAGRLEEARSHGDLRENAEYDAAKNEQGMLELRINQLQTQLRQVQILDESHKKPGIVGILSTVRLKNHNIGKEFTWKLVDSAEANFEEGKISTTSPIGKAIMGQRKGAKVKAQVPAGILKLEILDVQ